MDIYDLKSFQQKVARFSVSPYAEAITTLAGLSPQVVSIANRLASSYASLRGTVQLLTTNEDNQIVDETTEAREVIARSAIVSAWNSMGSAVERLVSLRRNLAGDGVTKPFPRTPINYTGGRSFIGKIMPCIVPDAESGDLASHGAYIVIPKGWENYYPVGPGARYVPLQYMLRMPFFTKAITKNPEVGQAFSETELSDYSSYGAPSIGSDRPLLFVVRLGTESVPSSATLIYMTLSSDGTSTWKMVNEVWSITEDNPDYYLLRVTSMTSQTLPASSVSTLGQFIGNGSTKPPIPMLKERIDISFPAASDQSVSFDPVDPYEVFTQAYQAASAVLELLEDMGYSSGLSQEDRNLLSPNP